MFRAGDIQRIVLLKFIRLCIETPCLCPSQGHKYGSRKLSKTCIIEFCYEKPVDCRFLRACKHLYEYLFSYKHSSDYKISADKSLFSPMRQHSQPPF